MSSYDHITMIRLGLGPWQAGSTHSALLTDTRTGTKTTTQPAGPAGHRLKIRRIFARAFQSLRLSPRRPARS